MTVPGGTAPMEPGTRLRWRWGVARFALLLVVTVCWLVALAGGRGGRTEVVACTTGTAAVALVALWDAACQRARNVLVVAGIDGRRIVDPLDSWYVVTSFALLTAIPSGTLPGVGALRWVLLVVCLVTAFLAWVSYRRHRV